MSLAPVIEKVLGKELPVAVDAYDGSHVGDHDAETHLVIKSPDALQRIVTSPGELGMARAYVAGDLDLEGSIWDLLALRDRIPDVKLDRHVVGDIVRELGGVRHIRRLPSPPEEVVLHGRRHSKARDAKAISYHYDVSNAFYRIVLGPSLTYSCAVFRDPSETLEQAQANKYELICRKLGLEPGMRLLDVGCGWGGMVLHAALHHGVEAVGVTISRRQAELAEKRIAEAGLSSKVTIRLQDYRDVTDGPFDAVSSIGMFEHVGEGRLAAYFAHVRSLVGDRGRLLNHGISRPHGQGTRLPRRSFVNRYVFPDGELHEVGKVISHVQAAGFEVRHVEDLREHYALTLRRWVDNLEANWSDAVAEVGEGRARVWRLYMAASAINFEAGRSQIHQVLGVVDDSVGDAGMPLRPTFE
jgi:cyclopropane-fatty-acyl-phospholipid synthase